MLNGYEQDALPFLLSRDRHCTFASWGRLERTGSSVVEATPSVVAVLSFGCRSNSARVGFSQEIGPRTSFSFSFAEGCFVSACLAADSKVELRLILKYHDGEFGEDAEKGRSGDVSDEMFMEI